MRRLFFLLLAGSLSVGGLPVPAAAQQQAPSTASPSSTPSTNGRSADAAPPPRSPAPQAARSAGSANGRSPGARPASGHAMAPASSRLRSGEVSNGRGGSTASKSGTTRRAAGAKSLGSGTERISAMGPDGDAAFDALHPAVTYNPASGEYFVVWAGTDDDGSLAVGETEIYGQRVDPVSAQPLGGRVRLSEMGTDGDPSVSALRPAVVYNPTRDDYFVVWQGSAGTGEFEIYGRTVGGSDLALGPTQRLTQMGTDGDATVHALAPSLAVNPTTGAYYLAWHSNADGETEVYGRLLDTTGQPAGGGPTALSAAGPAGDPNWRAVRPAAAYAPTTGTYWVAWSGSDDGAGTAPGEREIFLRPVGGDGTPGPDALRISRAGPDGDAAVDAVRPSIVADASAGEVFVVWSANAPDGGGGFEVYAQRVDPATGTEIGTDDLRLSTMGADGATAFSGFSPAVANIAGREYGVVWRGDDTTDDAFEMHVQTVYADRALGDEGPEDDRLLTSLSGDAPRRGAVTGAIARSSDDTYLVVWSGDTVGDGLVEGEHEIFGRIVGDGDPLPVELAGFEAASSGDAIQLTWRTLSETNSHRFEVQRRAVARSAEWATLGTVRAAGTASGPVDYQFTDTRLPYAADEVVYRLRQVDVDGTASLSEELRVARSGVLRLELLAPFPNPTRTAATVRFAVPEFIRPGADGRLVLYDLLGRRVRVLDVGSRPGRQELQLDVSGLASGLYVLRLEVAGQQRTRRLAIVR